ncbi:MAG: BON domain-containing protein [Blastochloris viridis]|uniref:BON domain-containing protein n=1 Tax=Blastochloris viridis TaxID=1079 RepID=A0A6N4R8S4_BLAVI|nr:MAG: BON domain-containing protein [Blastochloris viridis]
MSRLLLTAAVLAVLVYTMVLGVQWLSPRIEQDIAGRVTTGLAEQGLLWADVDVKGRDVVLTGEAPDAEAKAKAVNVATRVFGVSNVQDQLTIAGDVSGSTVSGTAVVPVKKEAAKTAKPAVDYSLTIYKAGESIAFEGNVPDESSKKVLMDLATNRYGSENVDGTKLVVVEGAPAGWRSAVGAVLMHISNMEQANVVVNGTEVMISGTVIDKDFSDKIEADVNQVLPKEYKVAFAVDVVTPTVPVEVEPAAGEETAAATSACDMADAENQVLLFGFDKADITAAHETQLKVVEKALAACADEKMVVAGFTDVTGSKLYNKWLSQQRAEATQRKLMRDGVAKDRLRAVGYGDLHPVGDNKTRDGRAKNRRVEFHAGAELPHAEGVVESKKAADVAPAKVEAKVEPKVEAKAEQKVEAAKVETKKVAETVKVKTVSATEAAAEKVDAAVIEPAAGATDAAASKASAIAKPWWASKSVSETAVEVK